MSEAEHALDQARLKADVDRTKKRIAQRDAPRPTRQESTTDPLDPKFDKWLRSIESRDEIVMRYAMRIRWPEVRASRSFSARIKELEAELKMSEDYRAMVMKDALTVSKSMDELIDGEPRR